MLAVIWCLAVLGLAMAQETPVGTVEGRVTSSDTGRPIAQANVWLSPEKEDGVSKNAQTDENGGFLFSGIPAGSYTIHSSGRVHNMPPLKITVREGKLEKLNLSLKAAQPFLNLYIPQRTFLSQEKPKIVLDGFTMSEEAVITLHKVNKDKPFSGEAKFIYKILREPWSTFTRQQLLNSPALEAPTYKKVKITKRDCEGAYQQQIALDPQGAGIYLVTASVGQLEGMGWIEVSNIGLVTKENGRDLMAYVAKLDSGEPVAGAAVKILSGQKFTSPGLTNGEGIYKGRSTPLVPGEPENRLIFACQGDSIAFVTSYTTELGDGKPALYVYTDRPIYRPGQLVYFKGIVRHLSGDTYRLPQQGEARVQVQDRRGTPVYTGRFPLTRFGSFNGQFALPEYASTGEYSLACSFAGNTQTVSFAVAEYRKPEFAVTVEMPKKRCVQGEMVKAKIQAAYYFGAPVVGAEVRYQVFCADYWFWPGEEEPEWGYGDYGSNGAVVLEGKIRTNTAGAAEIPFPAQAKQAAEKNNGVTDRKFTVSVVATEPGGREATAEGSIIATQGEFKICLEPEQSMVAPGEPARFKVTAIDYESRPRSGVKLTVEASQVRWREGEESYAHVERAKVLTDADGRASFNFKPSEPGSYRLQAAGQDEKGNQIKAFTWIWVTGRDEFSGYRYPELEIILDKKFYVPGEVAKILINSKEKDRTALLTVEGRQLFAFRSVKLTGKSTLIEIPVPSEYRPNFYLSVGYVKDKRFISQTAEAKVSLKEQILNLTVTPSKKNYEPGEVVTCRLKTVNAANKPVQAEVSLGVVDEAIYALRQDRTESILDFFYAPQYNLVVTNYSFPEVYLSGDKGAPAAVAVRKKFVDTAYWRANIETDVKGEAKISFKMPDNLTSWRFTGRACTLNTAVGEYATNVICTKNFLVRLQTPRFLVSEDKAVITALVHNYRPEKKQVTVTLKASGIKVYDHLSRTVSVPPAGVKQVTWRICPTRPGKASLTAYAACPGAKDAVEITLPVHPRGQRLVQTLAGSSTGEVVYEKLVPQPGAVPGDSEISLRFSPSLAAALLGSLEYLAQYPYGCVEQTMSAFLPDVVVWRVLKSLGLHHPELEKELPAMVGKGLNRLYDLQNGDNGGWGWCRYGQEDLWMTSYVAFGLLTAQTAGFEVNKEVLDRGLSALERQLTARNKEQENKLFGLYVLSLAGQKEKAWAGLQPILKQSGTLNSSETALAALTLEEIGKSDLARDHLRRLWDQAIVGPNEIYWACGEKKNLEAPTETTAIALMAVIKMSPEDERIIKVVRWILNERRFNRWYSTRDTAFILYALSDYLAYTKELQPDFTVDLWHNGLKVKTLRFDKESVFLPEQEVVIRPGKVSSKENFFQIKMHGEGVLYYTLRLTQYVDGGELAQDSGRSGITVVREYRKLVLRRLEKSGLSRLEPARTTATTFKKGDVVRVKLIINSPREYRHLLVEDYLPAGGEAFDRGRMEPWEWNYWWVDRDVRDERVTFYVEKLPRGKSMIEYEIRAGIPGVYHTIAPLVESMYQPEIRAGGSMHQVRID